MAKLTARGRTEIVRFSKVTYGRENDPDVIKEKESYAIMSDRKILRKRTVTCKDQYSPKGKRDMIFNWTIYGTIKKEVDLNEMVEKYKRFFASKGYEIEYK